MTEDSIVIVSSCDERYIIPLTVMVRSLLENLASDTRVNLYVFQDDVSAASRRCAEDSWKPFPIQTQWITPGRFILEQISKDNGFAGPPAIYFRLFIEELLPAQIMKAIYLDADTLVLGDLSELWNMELKGSLLLAVQDAYAEAFHLRRMQCLSFKEDVRFDSESPYFNAGVLVIDLSGWRKEAVGKRALQFMKDYGRELTFCDQDALNCALQKRWRAIDLAWNYHELPDCLFLWERRFYSPKSLKEAIASPKVIHFIARAKPWMRRCCHTRARAYHCYLSRTFWQERKLHSQSGMAGLMHRIFILPHGQLNQLVWRSYAPAIHSGRARSLLRLLGMHPWMIVTYPFWQLLVWFYFLLFLPVDRRRLMPGCRRTRLYGSER